MRFVVLGTPQVQDFVYVSAGETKDQYVACTGSYSDLLGGSTMKTVKCNSKYNHVARYVNIRPDANSSITWNYITLCEVIIRGHVYNRNMTVFHGKYNFIVSVSA